MDVLKDRFDEVGIHSAEHTLCTALVENLGVAHGLNHSHVVFLLVLSDFATDSHSFGEQFDERVVNLVNLLAEGVEALGRFRDVADDEFVKDEVQHVGRHLLFGIAPCSVGVAVAFNDEAVKAEVHGLLAERSHQFACSADVARVADDGEVRTAATEFDGDVPHGQVAVDFLFVGGEAAVNHAEAGDAGLVDALQSANPEFKVGVHGVLDKDGDIDALERVCDFLHGEGVSHGARTNPKHVDACFEGCFHMSVGGDFGADLHVEFLLHALHPGETFFSDAFKTTGFRARFPNAGAEKLHAFFCQAAGGVHHLFFSFRRAGTCDDHGAHFLFAGQIQRGEIEFQSIIRFCGYLFLIIPLYMREM